MLVVYAYFLLVLLGLIIYMVRATRQYGRWLRDNYGRLCDCVVGLLPSLRSSP